MKHAFSYPTESASHFFGRQWQTNKRHDDVLSNDQVPDQWEMEYAFALIGDSFFFFF